MEAEILKVAVTQGLWATLAVCLIYYNLKAQEKRDSKQDEREEKYQKIISQLTQQLNVVNDLKDDILEVKNYIIKK
jgi:glucosamine 6-phosphate synthetase-like amidotransferase/phosphosugar isomerase protein